jgi:hypothetical protein
MQVTNNTWSAEAQEIGCEEIFVVAHPGAIIPAKDGMTAQSEGDLSRMMKTETRYHRM